MQRKHASRAALCLGLRAVGAGLGASGTLGAEAEGFGGAGEGCDGRAAAFAGLVARPLEIVCRLSASLMPASRSTIRLFFFFRPRAPTADDCGEVGSDGGELGGDCCGGG